MWWDWRMHQGGGPTSWEHQCQQRKESVSNQSGRYSGVKTKPTSLLIIVSDLERFLVCWTPQQKAWKGYRWNPVLDWRRRMQSITAIRTSPAAARALTINASCCSGLIQVSTDHKVDKCKRTLRLPSSANVRRCSLKNVASSGFGNWRIRNIHTTIYCMLWRCEW